jgi:hypothetical protein
MRYETCDVEATSFVGAMQALVTAWFEPSGEEETAETLTNKSDEQIADEMYSNDWVHYTKNWEPREATRKQLAEGVAEFRRYSR